MLCADKKQMRRLQPRLALSGVVIADAYHIPPPHHSGLVGCGFLAFVALFLAWVFQRHRLSVLRATLQGCRARWHMALHWLGKDIVARVRGSGAPSW